MPQGMRVESPQERSEIEHFQEYGEVDEDDRGNGELDMRHDAPKAGGPSQPAYRVDGPDGHVHHHVVPVVEVDERHVVNVVGEYRRAAGRRGDRLGVVRAHQAEEEGEEGISDDGEGAEVVHLFGELECNRESGHFICDNQTLTARSNVLTLKSRV